MRVCDFSSVDEYDEHAHLVLMHTFLDVESLFLCFDHFLTMDHYLTLDPYHQFSQCKTFYHYL